MEKDLLAARALHILGLILWVGGLFAVGRLLVMRAGEADGFRTKLGGIARRQAMLADLGALFTILSGAYMLYRVQGLLRVRDMQVKLALIVLVLAIHGLVRVAAKKASQDPAATLSRALLPALGIVTIAIVALVVFKPLSS